jgi:hypothetical protein
VTRFQAGQLISNSGTAETLLYATVSRPTAGAHSPFCPRGTGAFVSQKQNADYILLFTFAVVHTKEKTTSVCDYDIKLSHLITL